MTISEKIVGSLPKPASGNKVHYFSGATLQGKKAPSGFAVRVTANDTRSFVLFYRSDGRKHLDTIGTWTGNAGGGKYTVLQGIIAARARADELNRPGSDADARPARTRVREDKKKPKDETVATLLDKYVERYVIKDAKLRSAGTIRSAFDRLVKPAIGSTGIYDLRRSSIVEMLDDIADNSGPVMADRVLAYLRKALNWRAARDDDFKTPIVKGMAKTKSKERARERILTDDELRAVWKAAEEGPFAAMVRFILLTAARRSEAAGMTWNEIGGADWTLPAIRNKTKVDLVRPLSKTAQAVLANRPQAGTYVFSTDGGKTPISGFSKFKRAFDRASGTSGWTPHDLRRTARSLMSRAGVQSDHAERCLGHVIGGVRGVYDRHEYHKEKRQAFEALAAQIERILNPTANVTPLASKRRR